MRQRPRRTAKTLAAAGTGAGSAAGDDALLRAAASMLLALGRPTTGLAIIWRTTGRAIYRQEEPAPAAFVKTYQQADELAHEAATLARVAAAGIPAPPLIAFAAGPPAVLITEGVPGIPLSSAYLLAAEEAGRLLRRFHALGAAPPFADGQRNWSAFIRAWAEREIAAGIMRGAFTTSEGRRLNAVFASRDARLAARPCALIHGDFQTDHVLVDPATQRVTAFLDFVEAQPGDPLLDIAVLTLWDNDLTTPILAGYGVAVGDDAALLDAYRLLRYIGAANWLAEHGLSGEGCRYERAARRYLHAPHGTDADAGAPVPFLSATMRRYHRRRR